MQKQLPLFGAVCSLAFVLVVVGGVFGYVRKPTADIAQAAQAVSTAPSNNATSWPTTLETRTFSEPDNHQEAQETDDED
jgi:hypothetical protein